MRKGDFVFTSELVSEGHPDKVCDRISDASSTLFLSADPMRASPARRSCTTQRIVIAGEVRGPRSVVGMNGKVKADKIEALRAPGDQGHRLRAEGLPLEEGARSTASLHAQSADIAQGVDATGNKDEGAGDQGIMFGYA